MAQHRHKRETNARQYFRKPRAVVVAGPIAVLATVSAVTLGVLGTGTASMTPSADLAGIVGRSAPTASDPDVDPSSDASADPDVPLRAPNAARGGARRATEKVQEPTEAELLVEPAAVRKAIRGADTRLWTTEALNLWTTPADDADKTGELDAGEKVLVTGRSSGGREEVVVDGDETRWVTTGYLTDEKPFAIGADCTNGTSVSPGVSPNIVKVHEAVCAAFPDITTYGTFRGDGEHAQGIAVDIMVSGEEGQRVADFVREHYADLGVSYVIYAQQIWSVQRSGEGWRGMEDRGSVTANHYDHVHVTTY